MLELADLIALRQVGIEIILAVKARVLVDRTVNAKPGQHGLFDTMLVQHRQHAREGRIDQADLGVRLRTEGNWCAGKQLRVGDHLGMDLQPDHHLPLMPVAFEEFGVF